MLHLGASIPNLSFAADSHYHHICDDVIQGGKMTYHEGCISVPKGSGLGVALDRNKVEEYAKYYKKTGGYPYDRDPQRPDWFNILPEKRWAVLNRNKS